MMNKLMKGAISGAAGIALLLGGAGSFALWNSSTTVNAGIVKSGTLTINAGTAAWTNVTPGHNDAISDINSFLLVPGNSVKLVQDVTIAATGHDIKGKLSLDLSSVGDTSLVRPYAKVSFTGSDATGPVAGTVLNGIPTATVTGNATVHVVVTITLPATLTGTDGQNKSLDLSHITLKLDQLPVS